MPVRNCSVIRKRVVVPNAYIHAPLFGAGWFRKRASPEIAPVRSSTQPTTSRPASAVRDPILPIALIASTSSPAPEGLRRPHPSQLGCPTACSRARLPPAGNPRTVRPWRGQALRAYFATDPLAPLFASSQPSGLLAPSDPLLTQAAIVTACPT